MISTSLSSFGSGHSAPSAPISLAVQPAETGKTAQAARTTPHVEATLNASVARTTIQAILDSSQAQKSGLIGRSVFAGESESKAMNRRISRAVSAYDEVLEDHEDGEDETDRSRRGR